MNLQKILSLGFDRSEHIPFTKGFRIRCSQCEACCINGVPCHETGCPNIGKDFSAPKPARKVKKETGTLNPYKFFLKHAGYSYDPKTETCMQGRVRCARNLARAEREARDGGFYYHWEIDPDCLSSDWVMDNEDGGKNCNPWRTWRCAMFKADNQENNARGGCVGSLHGIDFGRNGEPWGQPYKRVVEAELALESLSK